MQDTTAIEDERSILKGDIPRSIKQAKALLRAVQETRPNYLLEALAELARIPIPSQEVRKQAAQCLRLAARDIAEEKARKR